MPVRPGFAALAITLALAPACLAPTCLAQPASGPSEPQLADAAELGRLATLAPLCGLRDDHWRADLRRAAMQSATGTAAHDDKALRTVPGSQLALNALSYGEDETLENFAAGPDGQCERLASDPGLPRADAMVAAFRKQARQSPDS